MSSATYQTKCPAELADFCEFTALIWSDAERSLYKDIQRGKPINDLKRNYQNAFGINARQFNSIHASLKGKMRSLDECHKRHIEQVGDQIDGLKKSVNKLIKKLKQTPTSCKLNCRKKTDRASIKHTIHQKKRKLIGLQKKNRKLQTTKTSLIFGGRKLWSKQFNLKENGYQTHQEWLEDWRKSRNSQFILVGSSDETLGCQNCQLDKDGRLKIKVAPMLEMVFGQYIEVDGVQFTYGQADIDYALDKGRALSFRFVRKDEQWYIFVTVERADVPYQSRYSNGMMGIDLNPGVIGWAYCDKEGNLKNKGQIHVNLKDRSSKQVEATLGDAIKQLVDIASHYQCPITIEDLDFSKKKASMKEAGVGYSRMLSSFAYGKFGEMLASRCQRWGIELSEVNPAYSSLVGLAKFMRLHGLSSDTAAALVLARRTLRKSERAPARYALETQVDVSKHAWSFWSALSKKVKGVRRHAFFSRVAGERVRGQPTR